MSREIDILLTVTLLSVISFVAAISGEFGLFGLVIAGIVMIIERY